MCHRRYRFQFILIARAISISAPGTRSRLTKRDLPEIHNRHRAARVITRPAQRPPPINTYPIARSSINELIASRRRRRRRRLLPPPHDRCVSIPPPPRERKAASRSCASPARASFPPSMSFVESVSPFMAHNRGHFERVIQFIIERKPPALVPSRLAGSLSLRLRTGH